MTDDDHYPGDTKAARDLADYPDYWTPEQRATAYWEAIRTHAEPHTTTSWEALLWQAKQRPTRRPQPEPDDDEVPF